MFKDNWPIYLISIAAAALLVFCIVGVIQDDKKDQWLLQQCILDGKKEYECILMIRRSKPDFVPMPMLVPVRR